MTTTAIAGVPRLRLSLLMWLAGMLGAVVVTVTVLPQLLRDVTLPAPLWVVAVASLERSWDQIGERLRRLVPNGAISRKTLTADLLVIPFDPRPMWNRFYLTLV